MKHSSNFRALAAGISFSISFAGHGLAIKDEENQGRWEKAAQVGPDKEVPGFLVNMGPTGARGILTKNSYIVKYIFKKSPATDVLQLNDEVYGANGKKFGTHVFGRTNINTGMEGPLQDLGLAIEDSEGKDGALELMVKRGEEKMKVIVQLEKLGRFADTFPVDCEKTKILQKRALQYLVDHPGNLDSQGRCVANLALLASDDKKFSRAGEKLALDWNKPYGDETWAWHLGFQSIVLGEYHLLTGDKKVLSTMNKTLDLFEGAQWKAPIRHRTMEQIKKKPASQAILEAANDLYEGGFGHAPYQVITKRGGGGYGPMQWPTSFALMSWQLAEDCGLEINKDSQENSYKFLDRGTTVSGKVSYGGEFTLNGGVIDSEKWKQQKAHKFSPKSGAAYLVYMLSEERKESKNKMKLHLNNIDIAYRDMVDGHACGLMAFSWGMAGVYASDDKKLKKKITNYYKAYFNLARCHGSDSYVVLPNRDYADGSYYRKNIRNHTTAAMAFIYSYSSPKLRIHGVKETPSTKKAVKETAQTPEKPKAINPYRTFTNAAETGTFEGSLLIFDHRGGIARILKRDGKTVDIDFLQLSEKDQEYLRDYYRANNNK